MSKKIKDELIKLTKELVLFGSTEDRPDELKKNIEFIKDYLNDSNLHIKEFCSHEKPSIVIGFKNSKKHKIMFNGHIDVIEGFDSQFTAECKDGKLVGRGTNDMKASVAAMLLLMKNLASAGKKPSLSFMIVSDEEIGGQWGTKFLIKKGYSADFCLCGEPTKMHVETKHKGGLVVRITAYGSSSHGSRPWQGTNAIEKLIRQYQKFSAEMPTATKSNKWFPTINPTTFVAKGPYNVTPSKAEMVLDIRSTEDYSNRKIIEILKRLNIKYKVIRKSSMMHNLKKDKYMKSLKKMTQGMLPKRIKYVKSCGGSDGRYFTEKGIPVVNFGPLGANHHKHNEYVEIEGLLKYYQILEKFVKEWG